MKLENVDILKLLPYFMRKDQSNIALSKGVNEVLTGVVDDMRLLTLWDKIDELPSERLDILAEELNIRWYDKSADIDTRRAVIKSSDMVHAKQGTKWAVENIITEYFGDGYVLEWFEYDGDPFHFKVYSTNPELVGKNYDKFIKLLNTVKRASTILDAVVITLSGQCPLYYALYIHDRIEYQTQMYKLEPITAAEYDKAGYTAAEYDGMGLTVTIYDYLFKKMAERGLIYG